MQLIVLAMCTRSLIRNTNLCLIRVQTTDRLLLKMSVIKTGGKVKEVNICGFALNTIQRIKNKYRHFCFFNRNQTKQAPTNQCLRCSISTFASVKQRRHWLIFASVKQRRHGLVNVSSVEKSWHRLAGMMTLLMVIRDI